MCDHYCTIHHVSQLSHSSRLSLGYESFPSSLLCWSINVLAIDSEGNTYVTDQGNNLVQKFDSDGNFITKWGSEGSAEGQFDRPLGISLDSAGNVYVVDTGNYRIQVPIEDNWNNIPSHAVNGEISIHAFFMGDIPNPGGLNPLDVTFDIKNVTTIRMGIYENDTNFSFNPFEENASRICQDTIRLFVSNPGLFLFSFLRT